MMQHNDTYYLDTLALTLDATTPKMYNIYEILHRHPN
jgi:hypothetical protein